MCAVPTSVIICTSVANRWPGRNWRFWSNPFFIVLDPTITTSTIFVLTFHILLTSISRSLHLLSFSVSLVLMFESFVTTNQAVDKSSLFYQAVRYQVGLLVFFLSVINGIFHLIAVPLSFMTHSGIIIIINCFYVYARYLHCYTWSKPCF
jgi:hypothetical protein